MTMCAWCKQEMASSYTLSCTLLTYTDFKDGIPRERLAFVTADQLHGVEVDPNERCHDCNVAPGLLHHPGCDVEVCARCNGQAISCGCAIYSYARVGESRIMEMSQEAVFNTISVNDQYIAEHRSQPKEIETLAQEAMIEALAAYAHKAWSGWIDYQLSKGNFLSMTDEKGETHRYWLMPPWAVLRWTRQAATPYDELPESEKESDRDEARIMLRILGLLKESPNVE